MIEEELEILYDAYFDELEKYGQNAKLNKLAVTMPEVPPIVPPPLISSLINPIITPMLPPISTFRPPTISNQDGSEVTVEDLAALAQSMGDPAEFVRDLDSLPNQGDSKRQSL